MRTILSLAVILLCQGVGAQEIISSPYASVRPYKIVLPNEGNEPPGVYGRSENGFTLILPGQIMLDSKLGPIVHQFEITKIDDRYLLMAVVDEKLLLITNESNAQNPRSVLQVGGERAPIRDVVTKRTVVLPPITSYKNYAVYTPGSFLQISGGTYQVVFVSVAFDAVDKFGPGMTFMMAVKGNRNNDTIELLGDPVLLDERFHEPESMARFIAEQSRESLKLRSPLLDHFAAMTDLSPFDRHPEVVERVRESLQLGQHNASSETKASVFYDFVAGRSVIDLKYDKKAKLGDFVFSQLYDIPRGVAVISLGSNHGESLRRLGFFNLALETKKEQDPNEIFSVDEKLPFYGFVDRSKPFGITAIDGRLWLFGRPFNGSYDAFFDLSSHMQSVQPGLSGGSYVSLPVEHSFRVTDPVNFKSGESQATRSEQFAIFSFVYKSKLRGQADFTATVAFRLRSLSSNNAVVDSVQVLSKEFYNDMDLSARIKVTSDSLLFDCLTPPQPDTESYNQAHVVSHPYMNLLSNDPKNAFVYKDPIRTQAIDNNISYNVYDRSTPLPATVLDPSGLYLSRRGTVGLAVRGQLLFKDNDENKIDIVPPMKDVKIGGRNELIDLRVFALDGSHEDGRKSFRLAVYVRSVANSFPPEILEIPIPVGFHRLNHVSIHLGRGDSKQKLSIIYSIAPDPADPENRQRASLGTHYSLVALPSPNATGTANTVTIVKNNIPMSPTEISNGADSTKLVVRDAAGGMYFVLTPQLSPEDRQFKVFSLETGSTHQPRQQGNAPGQPKFKMDDLYAGESETSGSYKKDSPWYVNRYDVEKRLGRNRKQVEDAIAVGLYSDFLHQLDQMVLNKAAPKNRILVVPDDQQEFFMAMLAYKYVATSKIKDATAPRGFSSENRALDLYWVDPQYKAQDQILENLDAIRHNQHSTSVIVGSLHDVVGIGNPKAVDPNKTIELSRPGTVTDDEDQDPDDADDKMVPHNFYMLVAGDARPFAEEREHPSVNPYSMLLIGTEHDLALLHDSADFEINYAIPNRFVEEKVPDPSTETRIGILERTLNQRSIRDLNLHYDTTRIVERMSLSEREKMTKVVEYAITRTSQIAHQKKIPDFEAFMKFQAAFAEQVGIDKGVLQSRTIDKAFVERVLCQAFDIPPSMEILPANHHLRRLADKDIVLKLMEVGYIGPLDRPRAVIEQMKEQTKPRTSLAIPSSFLIYGDSGTGKTELVKGIIRLLGFREYDFSAPDSPDNQGSQALIINANNIVKERKDARGDSMTLEDVRNHIGRFLMLPGGPQGIIVFDDVHVAPKEIRKELTLLMRSFFDAPNGRYTASYQMSKGQQVTKDVPVYNLNIFMMMNLVYDQTLLYKILGQFKGRVTQEEAMVLATMSPSDTDIVDDSFLKRVGKKIGIFSSPAGAKAPQLMVQIGKTSAETLTTKSRMVLVAPSVADMLAKRFEGTDLRVFGAASTSEIFNLADRTADTGGGGDRVILISPTRTVKDSLTAPTLDNHETPWNQWNSIRQPTTASSSADEIGVFVSRQFKAVALGNNLESHMLLMNMVADSYRNPMYEGLVNAIQENPAFTLGNPKPLSVDLYRAIYDHLSERFTVPVAELHLNPVDFGANRKSDRTRVRVEIEQFSARTSKVTPFFPAALGDFGPYVEVTDNSGTMIRNRRMVMSEYVKKLIPLLEENLRLGLSVRDLERLPPTSEWLRSLPQAFERDPRRQISLKIVQEMTQFIQDMYQADLSEMQTSDYHELNVYGAMRLFMFTLDRAIFELPWTQVEKFVAAGFEEITKDQVLSQYPGVQNYFFGRFPTLAIASTVDRTLQTVSDSLALSLGSFDPNKKEPVRANFISNCERFLTQPGEAL